MDHIEFAKSQINTSVGSIFIKNVSMLDFAIFDPSSGIYGNSLEVDIIAKGVRNDKGFVIDFSHLKSACREILKNTIDHALVVPMRISGVSMKETNSQEIWTLNEKNEKYSFDWIYSCPQGAVYPLDAEIVTTELLEKEIAKIILKELPNTVSEVIVSLKEAHYSESQTFFRYTHGLPLHEGLCQRLFHGHKSQLEVYVNEKKRKDLEEFVVNELFNHNVHIATLNQVKSGQLEVHHRSEKLSPITISYEGGHGVFEAQIPAKNIFTILDDTSIESLTWQLAAILKSKIDTNDKIKVFCYEGINKGSMTQL